MVKAPSPHHDDDEPKAAAPAASGADEYKREQEKGGKDPVDPPQKLGPAAELMPDDPHSPYPTGSPHFTPTEKVAMNADPDPDKTKAKGQKAAD